MTEERKEELRAILQTKQRNGVQAAASVLQVVDSLRTSLDPSELLSMTAELAEHFRNAELVIERVAEAYEIEKYGVDLLDIDGHRDEPFMGPPAVGD
jgi:hypothetical protein